MLRESFFCCCCCCCKHRNRLPDLVNFSPSISRVLFFLALYRSLRRKCFRKCFSLSQLADSLSGWESLELSAWWAGGSGAALQSRALLQHVPSHPRRAGEAQRCGPAAHGREPSRSLGALQPAEDESRQEHRFTVSQERVRVLYLQHDEQAYTCSATGWSGN